MRARLLQFVTGSSRVPLQGFKALQGMCVWQWNLWQARNLWSRNSPLLPKAHRHFLKNL